MRWNRFLTAVLFLCPLFVCRISSAEELRRGLYVRGEKADPVRAPSLGTSVEVRVTGIIARARVTQIFTNPTQEWVEGIYIFPLPEDAAVDTLRMTVGERVLRGVIQEKQEARQTYEAAKKEGTKATLIEQQRPDVFTTSVANIGPGETVEIAIELQQIIPWDKGRFRLRFPMVVAERYHPAKASTAPVMTPPVLPAGAAPVNPFSFHVELATGFPLGRIESPSHRISVEKGKTFHYAVDLAEGVAPADGDFILEWSPAVGREPRAVFYSEEVDGEQYGLLMVMPPDAPGVAGARLARETIFIIDTSSSMGGGPMDQARKALLLALDRLQPGDWFNVIQFNSGAAALFSDSVPADAGTLTRARQYVGGLKADGGTNMLPALEIALQKSFTQPGLVRQVVFITDGQVGNEPDIYRFIAGHLGERRLFTVAIGSAPNASFLRKSAEIGRGTFTHIADVAQVAKRMSTLFAQLEAPMLQDIEVRWDDPAAEAWPERVPDLYLGEPLVVTARRSSSGEVAVSGRREDEVWADSFPAAARINGVGIDKLWARKKIESLEDSLRLQTGVDPEEVRRTVTELGLRHHLVTAFTSLVAVDVTPTAPAGIEPASRTVPVNPPRGASRPALGGGSGGDGVQDCIVVTAESPLLDERRITTGATVSQTDLESIPTARDPWAVLSTTPGVLADRINVGGNESGQQSRYVAPGSQGGQAVWSLDGLVVTDMSALGSSPGYYDFDAFEEIQVTTGGAEAALGTPGAQVNLVTKRGTNEWRGSGHLLGESDDLQDGRSPDTAHQVDALTSGGAEGGGPLWINRIWIWGALHRKEIDLLAPGGQDESTTLTDGSGKLNGQLSDRNSVVLAWNGSGLTGLGLGASPSRAPETTWEREGGEDLWKLEDTQIASSNFYFTGMLGLSRQTARGVPLGGPDEEVRIDAAGVAHGTWFGLEEERRMRSGDLSSSLFFNTGEVSHEVKTGLAWREQEDRSRLTPPGGGLVRVAGEILGLPEGTDVVESWHGGEVEAGTEAGSLWLQDILSRGHATLSLGLRYDVQDPGIPGGPRPRILAPRLGLTWTVGSERQTLLRSSIARFVSRLGDDPAFRLHPGLPVTEYFLSTGGGLRPWYTANLDHAVAPDLAPEITDELLLGIEHALLPDFLVGLEATWRRTGDILEDRLLVRDLATGQVFTATAADWVPAGSLAGALPDGTPYDVPVYDLRPGLAWTGGSLLVNGDRRQDSLGLTLHWQKRLTNGWSSRGHLTWNDRDWHLGSGFTRFDDPTNTLGSGDDEGQPVAAPADLLSRPYEADRFVSGRWAFYGDALIQLPRDFSVSFAVNGREGAPLAWYRQAVRERAGLARVQLTDRIDSYRADDLFTLDGRIAHELGLFDDDLSLVLSLDVFNLLDEGTVLEREADLGTTRAGLADRTLAGRTFRLGVRVGWR